MSTELIVNASLPETRIALMEGGEIQELLVERASGKGIVGNIYKGRVTRVLPGMQAAFVDIGLEKAAFLYVDDVYVHSDIWADEEGDDAPVAEASGTSANLGSEEGERSSEEDQNLAADQEQSSSESDSMEVSSPEALESDDLEARSHMDEEAQGDEGDFEEDEENADDEEEEEEEDSAPMAMSLRDESRGGGQTISEPESSDDDADEDELPANLASPEASDPSYLGEADGSGDEVFVSSESDDGAEILVTVESLDSIEEGAEAGNANSDSGEEQGDQGARRRFRRGRRGGRGRYRRGGRDGEQKSEVIVKTEGGQDPSYPENYSAIVSENGDVASDRAQFTADGEPSTGGQARIITPVEKGKRPEFREQRGRDRRIKSKNSPRAGRPQVNIQDLLKEGQEVIVQIAKDPIATKGARLTCHISLPGRHLVCMPTIDHVGVSRRIDRDEERRRLRECVDSYRPKGLGFIVRTATASGKQQSEKRIKQDIDYLSQLWEDIRSKANNVSAPALVYEDLNPILRAIRDWVNEDIDKIVVDSRYHYNDMVRFISHFMPSLKENIELYQGDIPIFDAYSISNELARGLERKVWLKSGGYIVVDQAEALVAIDVNTGRYVGKKSLEDTILKTNLEAVKEVAYQMRLRNCGGIIIIDLIDMEKEENKFRVYRALEDELRKDRARPQILKISELGLIEMTRKRTRDTMVRALCESCSHCEGNGFIKSKQTVAYEILRDIERVGIDREITKILVQAHPDVIDQLAIDERESLDQLERRYRKTVYLQAVTSYHPEQFEVVNEKKSIQTRSDDQILDRARESTDRESGDRGRKRDRNRNRNRNRNRDENREGRDNNRDTNREGRDQNENREGRDQNENREGRDRNENRNDRGDRNRNRNDRNRNDRNDRNRNDRNRSVVIEPGSHQPQVIIAQPAVNLPDDEDAIGNRVSFGPVSSQSPDLENQVGVSAPQQDEDDFMTEEDRQAFHRAQSMQDAAIARMGQNSNENPFYRQGGNAGGSNRGGGFKSRNPNGGGSNAGGGGSGSGQNRWSRGGRNAGGQNAGNQQKKGGHGKNRFQSGFRGRNDRGGPVVGGGSGGIQPRVNVEGAGSGGVSESTSAPSVPAASSDSGSGSDAT